jgi:hypothetical protein
MPGDVALALACAVCVAALFCSLVLRHAPLGVLTALAPLPGVWFARSWNADVLPAYGFGLSVAAVAAAGLSRARRNDRSAAQADMVMAVYGGVLVMLLRDWRLGLAFGSAALSAALVPLLGRFLTFDEAFIARANRLQERSMPVREAWAAIAQPRWGLALAGAGLVLAVLGIFRTDPVLDWRDGAGLALVAAATAAITRDYRWVLAALAAGLTLLLCASGLSQFVFFLLVLALRRRALREAGNFSANDEGRILEQGGDLAFAGAAGLVAFSWAALGAPLAALVLAPALAAALRFALPERRPLEDLYRG